MVLLKVLETAFNIGLRYAKPIMRGLTTYEKPLFNWAYKGQPRWVSKKAWNYYKASTVTTIVKPGIDAIVDSLTTSTEPSTGEDPQARKHVQFSGTKRQYNPSDRFDSRCRKPYRKRRSRYS